MKKVQPLGHGEFRAFRPDRTTEGRTNPFDGDLLRSVHPFGMAGANRSVATKGLGGLPLGSIWALASTIQPECRGCGDQDQHQHWFYRVVDLFNPDGLGLSLRGWVCLSTPGLRTVTGVDGSKPNSTAAESC